MKNLITLIFLCVAANSFGQSRPYTILNDTVRFTSNSSKGATLKIESKTKDTIGFLFNTGDGITEFRRGGRRINPGQIIIGADTVNASETSGTIVLDPSTGLDSITWAANTIYQWSGGTPSAIFLNKFYDGWEWNYDQTRMLFLNNGSVIDSSDILKTPLQFLEPLYSELVGDTVKVSIDTTGLGGGTGGISRAELQDTAAAIRGDFPTVGGSQNLQQTLTTGSTLTQANTTNNGGFTQYSSGGKNRFDSIGINPSVYIADSVWFAGTSITAGIGASSLFNRYSSLVSHKLNAIESNNGCSGCSMTIQGISTELSKIPSFTSKHRWIVLEWGVNDMQLGVTDTATFAAAYLRYLDTVIARNGSASKILILSPSFVDSVVIPAATTARQNAFNICTQSIAARRGTLYLDIYSIAKARGGSTLLPDGIHPSDYGVSSIYVNPITNKLKDSVRTQGQQIAINGLAEFQKIKFRGTDTADYKTVPIGMDTLGNFVRYDKNALIGNSILSPQPQGASISITGSGYFGNVSSPTLPEKVQINGTLKALAGRFTGSLPTGLIGSSTYLSFVSNVGYLQSYDHTSSVGRVLQINAFGGQVLFGNASPGGSQVVGINGGTSATWGQFTGSVGPTTGSGVEMGMVSGVGYVGAYNRTGGSALNLSIGGLGGNQYFGALAASGSNKFQFTGAGHFSSGLNIGSNAAPTSTLQTTSFASAYVAKTGAYTATSSDYTIDCTSGTFNVTLPTAVGCSGRVYVIKNSGAGVITVVTTSSQTIDGSTTYSLPTQYKYLSVQSNNANWITIANN